MRILIVEDELMVRVNLQDLLEVDLFTVEVAGSISEGIVKAKLHAPDVILCDWLMPDGTGAQIMDLLPHIPMIIISTLHQTMLGTPYSSNAAGYLHKPFMIDSVLFELWKLRDKHLLPVHAVAHSVCLY